MISTTSNSSYTVLRTCLLKSLTRSLATHSTETNALTITDPLVIYKNYVARGLLKPDEQQMRAAIEFHKLYLRVKDYQPPEKVSIKIKELVRKIELNSGNNQNTYMSRKFDNWKPKLFQAGAKRTEMIKIMTDEEELRNFPSPQGLLINGPVGSGKSLLMDIFASSLPHDSKCRWHYHNFMLWVYGEIHSIYKRRMVWNQENHSYLALENEFILFEILQKMISKSTILILDEFMLPDIAAAKLIQILFTYFFKMGGVVVATSNRLPEDLYSTEFNRSQFQGFLDILKFRCQSIDISSDRDYRKILSEEAHGSILPYFVVMDGGKNLNHEKEWDLLIKTAVDGNEEEEKWVEDTLIVYGREVRIPYHNNGVVKFEFSDICHGLYGPGDYISIASTYHTVILDHVPVMTLKMRNEARRFITFLDALYESKCKLIMRSDSELDLMFFPDANKDEKDNTERNSSSSASNMEDVQNEEMFSKTAIALLNPYRPNISSYNEGSNDYKPIIPRLLATDFGNVKKFTGEDEMFAYKRAVSRMKEMLGSPIWRQEGRWSPIEKSMRPWEGQHEKSNSSSSLYSNAKRSATDNKAARAYTTAPSFKEVHFWDLVWVRTAKFKDDITSKWAKSMSLFKGY